MRIEGPRSSMIFSTPVELANEIRMLNSQHSGAILLVEGRDDRLFMERFTNRDACIIVPTRGKDNVLETIAILDAANVPGVLGMVDADLERVLGGFSDSANIVMPEYHDLETMLMCSPALERVLVEYGSRTRIENFGEDVLEAMIERALLPGYLRLLSQQEQLGLKFQCMSYSSWIDHRTLSSSIPRLIQHIKNRSQRPELSSDELENELIGASSQELDRREICNGDDLVGVLSVALRRVLGDPRSGAPNSEVLRRSLRLAYTEDDLKNSYLGQAIQEWESEQTHYTILRK